MNRDRPFIGFQSIAEGRHLCQQQPAIKPGLVIWVYPYSASLLVNRGSVISLQSGIRSFPQGAQHRNLLILVGADHVPVESGGLGMGGMGGDRLLRCDDPV